MGRIITVKGVEGRVAYTAPVGGDLFEPEVEVTLRETEWITRRIAAEDIVRVKPQTAKRTRQEAAKEPEGNA